MLLQVKSRSKASYVSGRACLLVCLQSESSKKAELCVGRLIQINSILNLIFTPKIWPSLASYKLDEAF